MPRQPALPQGATPGMDVERGGAMSTTERTAFADLLAQRGVLIADGATGTNYQTMGMEPGLAPEEWLFDAPDRVVELHRAFVVRRRRHRPHLHVRRDIAAARRGATRGTDARGEPPGGRARTGGRRRRPAGGGIARPDRSADRALRAAQPRGSDRGVRRAGSGARGRRRRPARPRDDLRRRGGGLGRRGDPERRPISRSSSPSASTWARGR